MDCSCPIATEVWSYSGWSSVASCTSLCCCRLRSCAAGGGLFTGSWVTTSGSTTSSLPGSIFAGWRLPEVGPYKTYAVESGNYLLFQAQHSALARSKSAPQPFNNSKYICYFYQLESNPNFRSPEPTENHTFFGNFPDPTGSSPRRTGNALILGLARPRHKSTSAMYEIPQLAKKEGR